MLWFDTFPGGDQFIFQIKDADIKPVERFSTHR